MILSRVWYVLLGVAVAVALYVVYVAVGQFNRQTTRALKEGLASDSQTVEWALKIDTPLGPDALLLRSVSGQEAVSQLFRFQLDLLSEDDAISFDSIVGKNVTLIFSFSSHSRIPFGLLRTDSPGICTLAPDARYGHNSQTAASKPTTACRLARSAGVTLNARMCQSIRFRKPPCVASTPLGWPVEPEV